MDQTNAMVSGGMALILLALVFVLGLVSAFNATTWLERRSGRVNQRRGRRAEHNARSLLEDEGFHVLDGQPRFESQLLVNGDLCNFPITPDMLVEKDGVRYVVEVKQLEDSSGIANASVRRQVTEYMVATGLPCLLIHMPEGDIDLLELKLSSHKLNARRFR